MLGLWMNKARERDALSVGQAIRQGLLFGFGAGLGNSEALVLVLKTAVRALELPTTRNEPDNPAFPLAITVGRESDEYSLEVGRAVARDVVSSADPYLRSGASQPPGNGGADGSQRTGIAKRATILDVS